MFNEMDTIRVLAGKSDSAAEIGGTGDAGSVQLTAEEPFGRTC